LACPIIIIGLLAIGYLEWKVATVDKG